jgi:hypothetical protein
MHTPHAGIWENTTYFSRASLVGTYKEIYKLYKKRESTKCSKGYTHTHTLIKALMEPAAPNRKVCYGSLGLTTSFHAVVSANVFFFNG